jgi:XisH protein
MARDLYHQLVRDALEKQGWVITHDPFYLDLDNRARIEIDLGAEKLICAEKGTKKIVVKSKVS